MNEKTEIVNYELDPDPETAANLVKPKLDEISSSMCMAKWLVLHTQRQQQTHAKLQCDCAEGEDERPQQDRNEVLSNPIIIDYRDVVLEADENWPAWCEEFAVVGSGFTKFRVELISREEADITVGGKNLSGADLSEGIRFGVVDHIGAL